MKWFDGPIPNAIQEAKQRKSLLIVFVAGEDEDSTSMETTWSDPGVTDACENSRSVALKLIKNTESCKQFAEFYPIVCVPSTFLISGMTGTPMEILGGKVASSDLAEKITTVAKDLEKSEVQGSVPSTSNAENPPPEIAEQGDIDSRVQRARELVTQRQAQKYQEVKEKERNDEIERRRMMKEVQSNRERQKEEEMKKFAEDRRKEKEADRLAKEKIKRQIAEDRAERAKKFSVEREAAEAQKAEQVRQREVEKQRESEDRLAKQSAVARLQFRFPDGSFVNHQFEPDTQLSEARDFVMQEMRDRGMSLGQSVDSFSLSTTFPRRIYTQEDMSSSLRDLHLAPSAAILVLPAASRTVSSQSMSSGGLTSLFWMFMSPLLAVFSYAKTFLFGAGEETTPRPGGGAAATYDSDDDLPGPARRTDRPHTAYGVRGQSGQVTRRGNVARLSDRRDGDDDENATWNGNSTQQM